MFRLTHLIPLAPGAPRPSPLGTGDRRKSSGMPSPDETPLSASTPFLLPLCKTRSPQPAPHIHLRRASHTTHTPSTAFSRIPVGVADNHGRISPFAYRLSNSPHSHSCVLENSHPSQPRALMHLHPDSHFSYSTYGCFCLFFISTHTYPPPPVATSPRLRAAPSFWPLHGARVGSHSHSHLHSRISPRISEMQTTFPRAISSQDRYNRVDASAPLPAARKLLYSGGIVTRLLGQGD